MTLHDGEQTPVLTNAPVLTHDQSQNGLERLQARYHSGQNICIIDSQNGE